MIGQMLSYTWPFQSQNQQRSKTIWSLVYNTTHWHYSNQQFQQSALTPFVTNTFFMTRWLEASFEKKIPTFYLRSAANNIRFPDPVSVFVVTLHFSILLIQLVLFSIGILFAVYGAFHLHFFKFMNH